MTLETRLVTAADLLHLSVSGRRYELVAGELRTMLPASGDHGTVAMRLSWRLAQYVETAHLGVVQAAETGYLLATNPDTVRAPDLAFVRQDRIAALRTTSYWRGAPDLVAEVLSPGDAAAEVAAKVAAWLAAGTQLVWVLDPRKRQVTVYRAGQTAVLSEDAVLSGEDVVPGWSVPVRDLFAPL